MKIVLLIEDDKTFSKLCFYSLEEYNPFSLSESEIPSWFCWFVDDEEFVMTVMTVVSQKLG